ncbi:MAG: gerQ [Cohnella sp.]|nr:gerQ [Cohnella sp.]
MLNNKMHWPTYPAAAGPTMVSPAMQGPGMGAIPNAGYPGTMPGFGGYPGAMSGGGYPGTMPGGGYPGYMTGVGGASTMIPGVAPPPVPSGAHMLPDGTPLPPSQEESYVENILRMNLGKVATIYMTFENNSQWNAKIFKGALEAAGRDHIIISDPTTGRRYLLLTVNLDYITFDEPLTYTLPFGSTGGGITRSQ